MKNKNSVSKKIIEDLQESAYDTFSPVVKESPVSEEYGCFDQSITVNESVEFKRIQLEREKFEHTKTIDYVWWGTGCSLLAFIMYLCVRK